MVTIDRSFFEAAASPEPTGSAVSDPNAKPFILLGPCDPTRIGRQDHRGGGASGHSQTGSVRTVEPARLSGTGMHGTVPASRSRTGTQTAWKAPDLWAHKAPLTNEEYAGHLLLQAFKNLASVLTTRYQPTSPEMKPLKDALKKLSLAMDSILREQRKKTEWYRKQHEF